MKHEPEGLPAGEVARLLEVPQNTMSTHLAVLTRAGLISFGTPQPVDHLSRRDRQGA